jgi:hypothetical protein
MFRRSERRWRVRHNRERESGAWLLIDAACEPLIATLEKSTGEAGAGREPWVYSLPARESI